MKLSNKQSRVARSVPATADTPGERRGKGQTCTGQLRQWCAVDPSLLAILKASVGARWKPVPLVGRQQRLQSQKLLLASQADVVHHTGLGVRRSVLNGSPRDLLEEACVLGVLAGVGYVLTQARSLQMGLRNNLDPKSSHEASALRNAHAGGL